MIGAKKNNTTRMDSQEDPSHQIANKAGRHWRAVYVSSRTEKKVLGALQAAGVDAYAPIVKTMKQWSDRKKIVELPLLHGYVFVRVVESDFDIVTRTPGVVRFVRCEGKIAVVRDIEIERLKQLVDLGYQLDTLAIDRKIRTGEKVVIGSGALKGIEGIVTEDKDQDHLLVLLESIGQCIRVRVPKKILAIR